MTLEQLEAKVYDLERQVADLRRQRQLVQPKQQVEATFGMFANDPEFDEIVRLGREYREQNARRKDDVAATYVSFDRIIRRFCD